MKKPKAETLVKAQSENEEAPRRAILSLSPKAFLAFFYPGKHYYEMLQNGLPPDATIVDVRMNTWKADGGTIEVLLEHSSLPPLVEGEPIPYVKPPILEDYDPQVYDLRRKDGDA